LSTPLGTALPPETAVGRTTGVLPAVGVVGTGAIGVGEYPVVGETGI
jgi:hypothetical protein